MFASVIINVTSSNVDVEYTYIIPQHLESLIKVGSRVKVPFGQSNRTIMGYVTGISTDNNKSNIALKEISELVDLEPLLSYNQLILAKYIKEDTICPLIRVLNLMIPEALQLKPVKYFRVVDYNKLDANIANIFEGKEIIKYEAKYDKYLARIKKAIDLGYIELRYDALPTATEKIIEKYKLNSIVFRNNTIKLSNNIYDRIQYLEGEEALTKEEIIDKSSISSYMFKKLKDNGYFNIIKEKKSRVKIHDIAINERFIKSNQQYDEVVKKVENNKTKPILWISKDIIETENVIERIVRNNVSKNKNTLILCPDILSSYRISSLIRKRTKLSVACINSELSKTEYLDLFYDIKKDDYRVIVTTSKGSLIEYPNLESIVLVDSENDCYYNDQSPRYDLKKVMHAYAKIYGVSLIYHTYFPSLDEYVKAIKGNYEIIEHQDFENDNLSVQVVDLKNELLRANDTKISPKLLQQIKKCKSLGKQALLISNRKYYSDFVMCRSCGEIIKCKRCDVAMKYSQKNNNLICPACGMKMMMLYTCPHCESQTFRMEGNGIEQIVDDLKKSLCDYRIVTISDSNYADFNSVMLQIENNSVDIIISTDLFSRSIIDKNIGLVGIIDLDEIIGNSSFLSNERAYSMLLHARQKIINNEDADMIIQTYHPDSFVIKSFITGEYKDYLKIEINNRKNQRNTPFFNINRIFIKGKYEYVFKEANHVKQMLQDILGNKVFVIGPTFNKSHQAVQLIVKHQILDINEYYNRIYEMYQASNVTIIFDKYPKYL